MDIEARCHTSVGDIPSQAWDALVASDDPFLEHWFLSLLERSGSVGEGTGWLPCPVTLWTADGTLCGAMPLYEKHDSFGEYIFDWGWADAAHRAGLPYYPKLVAAVPFTPAGRQRLLTIANHDSAAQQETWRALMDAAEAVANQRNAHSIHGLFVSQSESEFVSHNPAYHPRLSYQYHWQRAPNWDCFDDYLAALRASARKQIRQERAKAAAHGLTMKIQRGTELEPRHWQALWLAYRTNAQRKGAIPYLQQGFFTGLQHAQPNRVLVAYAETADQQVVATALFFQRGNALYGRYWGCAVPLDCLHFELCYYLPIAWALDHGIERFEAGAQGQHKIKRGLLPSPCYSFHNLQHPGLHEAVGRFIQAETEQHQEDMAMLREHTPFKRPC